MPEISYRGRVRDWIAVRCNAGNAAPRARPVPSRPEIPACAGAGLGALPWLLLGPVFRPRQVRLPLQQFVPNPNPPADPYPIRHSKQGYLNLSLKPCPPSQVVELRNPLYGNMTELKARIVTRGELKKDKDIESTG